MAKWRVRRHDGDGVTDLGLLDGRPAGRKIVRQHLSGIAVNFHFSNRVPPLDAARFADLMRQAEAGLIVAYSQDRTGVVFTAEEERQTRTPKSSKANP